MANLYVEDVDDDLWRIMDADQRTKKDIVEAALWEHFGGRKKSALEAKKQHKLDQLNAINAEIEEEKKERERIQRQIDALDVKIENYDERESAYDDDIEEFVSDFANSRAVFPRFRSDVEELAEKHGRALDTVVSEIKEYAERSDYEIDNDRWTDSLGDGII